MNSYEPYVIIYNQQYIVEIIRKLIKWICNLNTTQTLYNV